MKSLVMYYSHSGNTARIAHKIMSALRAEGNVELLELRHSDSKRYKIRHFLARFFPVLTELSENLPDFAQYDLICLGSPVWSGKPAPLALKLLSRLKAATGKYIIYFQIYGLKSSGESAIEYVKKILKAHEPSRIKVLNISFKEARDEQILDAIIKDMVEQVR